MRVARDTHILPGHTSNVEVEGCLTDYPEWLLERSLLSTAEDRFFAAPNVLFSSENPRVPIANLSAKARTIRKGEVIGIIAKPIEAFDKPANLEDLEKKMKHGARISVVVNALHASSDGEDTGKRAPDCEQWGPKGAELPTDEEYRFEDLEKLIDVGTLPDHLKDKAWQML